VADRFANVVILGTPIVRDLIRSEVRPEDAELAAVVDPASHSDHLDSGQRLAELGFLRRLPEDGSSGRFTERGTLAAKLLHALVTEAGVSLCVPPKKDVIS
jgi:hypothetical protein